MIHRYSVFGAILVVVTLLICGCEGFNSDNKIQPPPKKEAELPTVKVAPVKRGDIAVSIFATGTILPQHQSKIGPKVSGTLKKVYVDEGDQVKKGQILAEMEQKNILIARRQCEASVRVAEAQLKEAEVKEENLRKEMQRLANLYEKKVISQQRYDDIVTAHSMAVTGLEVLGAQILRCKENLAMADQKLKDSTIVAPFSGMIVKRLVNQGEYITTMPPTVLFLIVNIDKVKTEVGLPEVHLARIATGNPVNIAVDTYPGVTFAGKITTINPLVDPVSRAFTVKIEISNKDHRLKAGMFARVTLYPSVHKGALIVPFKSVVRRDGKTAVFVINGEHVSLRAVTIGITSEQEIEVIDGLRQGEEVVVEGHYGMADNTKVQVLRN
ncbi:MAG: efflux RND transporter periplasmic adaptor subunit [Deltaproteobacteria bacterium]|nr:efflux RND transporter periplasmic adaptor subunit [Deltaproteobacteria bacterium]